MYSNLIYLLLGALIYAIGIKHGKSFAEHKKVDIIPNPIKAFNEYKETKETKHQEEEMLTSVENMMSYTGIKQKEG